MNALSAVPVVRRRIPRPALRVSAILVAVAWGLALQADPVRAQIDAWIDPGHGGHDPGALGVNGGDLPDEKQLNIGVARYLESDLFGLGLDAYLTQNSDSTYFTPQLRRRIANGELPNDLGIQGAGRILVSIHMNSSTTPTARGTETWYSATRYDAKTRGASVRDKNAAQSIHAALMTYANVAFLFCSTDRGIKPGTFAVLRKTKSLALLIEVCFISNGCQFNNIVTPGDQALMADGIAAGVSGYLSAAMAPPAEAKAGADARQAAPSPQPAARAHVADLEEDFEDVAFPPAGWTIQTTGPGVPYAWHRAAASMAAGEDSSAAMVGGESQSAIDEWLISPVVELSAVPGAIRFKWAGSRTWASAVNASLCVRPSEATEWTVVWSLIADEPPAEPFIFRERAVDLSPWAGTAVEFGFRVVGTNGADFLVDEISVGEHPPTATASNDLCANATQLSGVFDLRSATCYAADDINPYTAHSGSCAESELDGPDVFYALQVSAGDSLHAELSSQWGATMYLVDGCLDPVCEAGMDVDDGRIDQVLRHVFTRSGSHFLVVDGEAGSCGPFALTGELVASVSSVPVEANTSLLSLAVDTSLAPGRILLQGRYPNSWTATATFEIFDLAGRRLKSGTGTPGADGSAFSWDARDEHGQAAASGLYLARLMVGNSAAVSRFVLLR